jgi:hypothetical protein
MRTTHSWSGLLGALALALALTGCEPERSRWSFAVQPDGSGCLRLIHETAGQGDPDQPAPPEPEDQAQQRATGQATLFLAGVSGVAAWTDVAATPIEGGRARIEATGWFHRLADVRVQGEPRFTLTSVGDDLQVTYADPIPGGLARLFLDDREKMLETFRLPEERFHASVHRTRGFVEMSLAGWQFDLMLRFPGQQVREVSGFERAGRDADLVTLHQDVEAVLALVDADVAVLHDLRQQVRTGACSPEEAYGQLAERLATGEAYRVGCDVLAAEPDPEFLAAFEAARATWERSEWKPRLERYGEPFEGDVGAPESPETH